MNSESQAKMLWSYLHPLDTHVLYLGRYLTIEFSGPYQLPFRLPEIQNKQAFRYYVFGTLLINVTNTAMSRCGLIERHLMSRFSLVFIRRVNYKALSMHVYQQRELLRC